MHQHRRLERATGKIHAELSDEIGKAFTNGDLVPKHTRGAIWCQIYRVNLYAVDMSTEAPGARVQNRMKWMSDH